MMGESVDPPWGAGEFSRRRDALSLLLQRHHGVAVDDVLQMIGYLRDEADCVIAGGSLAFGMGNRLSDLDIVVAARATSESSRVPLEHFAASLRIDVWKMNRKLIDDLFACGRETRRKRSPARVLCERRRRDQPQALAPRHLWHAPRRS